MNFGKFFASLTFTALLLTPNAFAASSTKLVAQIKEKCNAFTSEPLMGALLERQKNREDSYDQVVEKYADARKARSSSPEVAEGLCQNASQLGTRHLLALNGVQNKVWELQPAVKALQEKECDEFLGSMLPNIKVERENIVNLGEMSCPGQPQPNKNPSGATTR